MAEYITELEGKVVPIPIGVPPATEVSSEWTKEESLAKSACPKIGDMSDDETVLRDAELKRRIKKGLDKIFLPEWVAPPQTLECEKYRINDIARDHWSYINGLLDVSLVNETYERDEVLKMIEFHYTTAMIHGWKHAMEVK